MTTARACSYPNFFLLLSLSALACSQPAQEAPPPVAEAQAAEVAWFHGTPEQAFAEAKKLGKPLFLYWGAEWCPPCHYLKDKIFTQPGFVERSREFVAVHLDGDDESAQSLGEQLDVQGYPTVMVYSADGDELLRMPSDVPVSRYAAIMQRALRLDRPVREILEQTLAIGPAAADGDDLDVLAYYSWAQDSQVQLADELRLATFRRLWQETPAEQRAVRSRFLGLYVGEASRLASEAAEGDAPALSAAQRGQLSAAMLELLGDPELCRENVFDVSYGAQPVITLLQPEPGAERTALMDAWGKAARRFELDEELSTDDRLTALAPSIDLARLAAGDDQAELAPELIARVRERVQWAVAAVSGGGELQAVLSTATALLGEVGLEQEAQQLLTDKLDDAAAPYYFISWLASLKSNAGDSEEAVALYRQAWQAAGGRYTRFRFGSTYLRQLMDLAPESVAQVETDSLAILDELLAHDDAFALGNKLRLGQLQTAYEGWNEDGKHGQTLATIRARVQDACERFPGDGEDSQQERCRGFLAA